MDIGIIGGGSIGLLTGAMLSEKHRITIYVRRKQQKQYLLSHGIVLQGKKCHVHALLLNEIGNTDLIIVCVKQFHLAAITPHINILDQTVPVIFLQNGMGHLEMAKELKNPVYLGVISHGAERVSDYAVRHTGIGGIQLAPLKKQGDRIDIASMLNQTSFPVTQVDDKTSVLYPKLIVNAVINPLTGLFKIKNGDIFSSPIYLDIAYELCAEAAHTLQLDLNEQWENVKKVIHQTKTNTSSMLSDLQASQKTEIDAISGYIVKHAKTKIPYTMFMLQAIKAIEKNKMKHICHE